MSRDTHSITTRSSIPYRECRLELCTSAANCAENHTTHIGRRSALRSSPTWPRVGIDDCSFLRGVDSFLRCRRRPCSCRHCVRNREYHLRRMKIALTRRGRGLWRSRRADFSFIHATHLNSYTGTAVAAAQNFESSMYFDHHFNASYLIYPLHSRQIGQHGD